MAEPKIHFRETLNPEPLAIFKPGEGEITLRSDLKNGLVRLLQDCITEARAHPDADVIMRLQKRVEEQVELLQREHLVATELASQLNKTEMELEDVRAERDRAEAAHRQTRKLANRMAQELKAAQFYFGRRIYSAVENHVRNALEMWAEGDVELDAVANFAQIIKQRDVALAEKDSWERHSGDRAREVEECYEILVRAIDDATSSDKSFRNCDGPTETIEEMGRRLRDWRKRYQDLDKVHDELVNAVDDALRRNDITSTKSFAHRAELLGEALEKSRLKVGSLNGTIEDLQHVIDENGTIEDLQHVIDETDRKIGQALDYLRDIVAPLNPLQLIKSKQVLMEALDHAHSAHEERREPVPEKPPLWIVNPSTLIGVDFARTFNPVQMVNEAVTRRDCAMREALILLERYGSPKAAEGVLRRALQPNDMPDTTGVYSWIFHRSVVESKDNAMRQALLLLDPEGTVHQGSSAYSGAVWTLRKALGAEPVNTPVSLEETAHYALD